MNWRRHRMKTRELTESGRSPSIDFTTMLQMLAQPAAFQGTVSGGDWFQKGSSPDHEPITVIQTHASAVVLTASRVYKLKKPKNFGFFDYSTPALRRHFCQQEVLLNARLAPQVYLGVAPVLLFSDDRLRFGPTFPTGDVPLPGTMLDGGRVVDYAVVMLRLPDEATLEFRVRTGTASPSRLQEIARYVAAFHATSPTDAHIASFGGVEVIRGNWEENFAQMKPYLDRSLDALTYHRIVEYIHHFLDERTALFTSRVRDGRIRDCHGDLRLQHVYVLDEPDFPAHRLAILDGIEFNERFRYSDVASEIAFLAMELEAAGRDDLSRVFVDGYVAETGDEALREILPFYICYRRTRSASGSRILILYSRRPMPLAREYIVLSGRHIPTRQCLLKRVQRWPVVARCCWMRPSSDELIARRLPVRRPRVVRRRSSSNVSARER